VIVAGACTSGGPSTNQPSKQPPSRRRLTRWPLRPFSELFHLCPCRKLTDPTRMTAYNTDCRSSIRTALCTFMAPCCNHVSALTPRLSVADRIAVAMVAAAEVERNPDTDLYSIQLDIRHNVILTLTTNKIDNKNNNNNINYSNISLCRFLILYCPPHTKETF